MHPTRRLWAASVLAVFLAAFAVVIARPLLLTGAGVVGAWILRRQYRFHRTLERTVDSLHVHQTPIRSGVRTEETVSVTLAAALDEPSSLALEIEGGVPTAAVSDEPLTLTLEPGETGDSRTGDVSWPVAGHHRFDAPTVTASNAFFRETVPLGSTPTVTVEPHNPRTIHVGEGGDRLATAYGEHEGGRHGSGIEPAELREYTPGDRIDRIDWKATARLSSPYVREYEAETDRQTLLIVDHRESLATGERGETKLEYLRAVALATAASARRLGDPIGLLTVGDGGITEQFDASTTPATYKRIRRKLLDLEPTGRTAYPGGGADVPADGHRTQWDRRSKARQGIQTTAADARSKLEALGSGSDAFTATLRPFYTDRDGYRQRIASDPLYGAVRTALSRGTERRWTIICTDDSRPGELREAVAFARRNGNPVMVLLAPTVLYESGGLADIDRTYDRYLEFEELRRELARMSRVTALEVGPQDRLSSVLAARRPRGGRA